MAKKDGQNMKIKKIRIMPDYGGAVNVYDGVTSPEPMHLGFSQDS